MWGPGSYCYLPPEGGVGFTQRRSDVTREHRVLFKEVKDSLPWGKLEHVSRLKHFCSIYSMLYNIK